MKEKHVGGKVSSRIKVENLGEDFKNWLETEAPKIDAFYNLLTAQVRLLREGQTDERLFLERLMENKEPVSVFFMSFDKDTGATDMLQVERTKKGKLRVKTQQMGTWPQMTVTIGLSEDGHLKTEDVVAEYVNPDDIVVPHKVKGDTIPTDIIDANGIGRVSKQEAGKRLIRLLINVVPFQGKLQSK